MDYVKAEYAQWIEAPDKILTPALTAAKFLWLCRINKVPLMLNEVSKGFGVQKKDVIHLLSENDYIPPLGAPDYISRISSKDQSTLSPACSPHCFTRFRSSVTRTN
jgi:hypothetical protein